MRNTPVRPWPARRRRMWRWPVWWPPVLGLLLGAVGGAGHALLAERCYAAESYVLVSPREGTDPGTAVGFAQAYGRMATAEAVLARAGAPPGRVRAATSPDAPVIEITGTGERPGQARRAANAVARALVAAGDERTGTELTLLAEARDPTSPLSPLPWLSPAVGGCAGAVTGVVIWLTRRPAPRRAVPRPPLTARLPPVSTAGRGFPGASCALRR